MTIDEIQKHRFYAALSHQQRVYVVARCLGKDKLESAKEAWQCANDESALASAYRAERNPNIQWLQNEFRGGNPPSREDVIKLAWELARTANDTKDKLNALKLVASVSGFDTTPIEPPKPEPKLNDGDEEFDES